MKDRLAVHAKKDLFLDSGENTDGGSGRAHTTLSLALSLALT